MAASVPDSNKAGPATPSRGRRRLLLAGFAAALLVALGASGWVVWTQWLEADPPAQSAAEAPRSDLLPPVDALYLGVPEIISVLADPPHLIRLGIVLEIEAGKTPQPADGDLQRVAEEIRRWLISQRFDELAGAAAMWTARARMLAIARDVLPEHRVRDVLIRLFLLQ